jgi:predicted N-acyltransferase
MSDLLPVQLRVHKAISELPQHAWDALVEEDGQPFLEWTWLDALEGSDSIAPARGWHPRHLALWRGSKLIAAAPAYIKDDSHGEFVFDWSWASAAERAGLAYYPKLILAIPITPATGPRILVARDEDRVLCSTQLLRGSIEYARSEGLSSVHVLFPTEKECGILESVGFAIRLGIQYHWLNASYRSYEDFLARFTSKRRHQLKREARTASEQGFQIRSLRGDDLLQVDPETVFQLYCATVDKYLWGRRHLQASFFNRIWADFRDRVEFVEARQEGRLVAGALNLCSKDVLYGRYWGCFHEFPFLHFNVCLYHPVMECIRRGMKRFEPGAGGEHKLVRGFEPCLTYSAHYMFHPGLDRAIRAFLVHERAAIHKGLPQWRTETGFKATSSERI